MDTELKNFTQQARRAITLGQTQARVLGHNYTGTEHLLLGLLQESAGLAAQLLTDAAVSTELVRQKLRSSGSGSPIATGQLTLTAHCRHVLELATNEADLLGQDYVGTEHLLLGLTRLPDCLGAEILLRLGGDLIALRTAVLAALAGPDGVPTPEPRPAS